MLSAETASSGGVDWLPTDGSICLPNTVGDGYRFRIYRRLPVSVRASIDELGFVARVDNTGTAIIPLSLHCPSFARSCKNNKYRCNATHRRGPNSLFSFSFFSYFFPDLFCAPISHYLVPKAVFITMRLTLSLTSYVSFLLDLTPSLLGEYEAGRCMCHLITTPSRPSLLAVMSRQMSYGYFVRERSGAESRSLSGAVRSAFRRSTREKLGNWGKNPPDSELHVSQSDLDRPIPRLSFLS
jgi:hypothetical protein